MAYSNSIGSSKTQELGLLILRVGVGVLFFIFGWQKLAAGEQMWAGVGSAMKFVGISAWPVFWGLLASISEFLGGLLLIFGLFTRFASIPLVVTMIVATILKFGLGGTLSDASPAIFALLVTIFFSLNGAGSYSADNFLRLKKI
ncbi:DoxX family membrane protein [Chitinophaga sp. SYP-B3965]|uniref:DoxX family protein n=1 Tax=Chitinophaga sp. SYP-B3965 TaxID=2663120 RepID=UPI0012996321|nr:DoxX family protein [Chitinophaga sp. SYP-B3965]MRG46549.1 DoxX family membrane protein [Chitinophaga sp. SYP-B3965]